MVGKVATVKAVGYIRVSTSMQAESGLSLADQEARMRTFAELQEFELIDIKRDEGISGKALDNRPGLQEALRLIDRGAVQALIVPKLDRFTRSLRDLINIVETHFSKSDRFLVSMDGQIDTMSAQGRFQLHLFGALAQLERETTSERVTAVMLHKKRQLQYCGGHVPYGYKLLDDGKTLEEIPDEQEVIDVVARLRDEGMSFKQISSILNKTHKRRCGTAFDQKAVWRMIKLRGELEA